MATYKVWVEVQQDPQRGYIVLEADSEAEAKEKAEEAFEDDSDRFTWDELDMTKMDLADAVAVEKVPDA